MDLASYIALLQRSDAALNARNAELLAEAADDLKTYAASIGHRQSGNMDDSMYRLGPFPIGEGAYEATIQSGADYAEQEVARGGTHDWATRTIDEEAQRIDRLRREVENALISVLTGS